MEMVGVALRPVECLETRAFERTDERALRLTLRDQVDVGRGARHAMGVQGESPRQREGMPLAFQDVDDQCHDALEVHALAEL